MKRKQKRTQINFKRTILATALLIEMGLGVAQAATINVDGTTCTLADAIASANNDAVTGGCTAGAGADVLELTASGVFTLTAALPDITTDVTINGNDSTVTRDPGAVDFHILRANGGGNLNLNDTTVTGGSQPSNFGAGVRVYDGRLNIDNCNFSGNTGGAVIFTRATSSSITNSVIDGNDGAANQYYGGGVSIAASQVTINNSTISNNTTISSAAGGGGVYITNYGGASNVLIENTTITGNSSTLRGGGISHLQYGNTTNLEINNSTISGNTSASAGGGISLDATVTGTFANLTVTANDSGATGGGLDMSGSSITLVQSLVAGNTATGTGREVNVSGGTLTVDDFNLFGFGGDSGLNGIAAGASDIEPADAIAAILDPVLADNGGNTFTHNLVPASPALDAVPGANCALPTDQTGAARPNGANCDIGSVEASLAINVDGTVCTLADAITSANTDTATGGCPAGDGDDTLELNVSGIYTLTDVLPQITTNITINGNGSTVTRDPGAATEFRIFDAYNGDFNLNDTTVTGGVNSANFTAGVLSINNRTNIDNCVFTGNSGGAIRFLYTSSSSITNSVIDGNTNSSASFYSAGVNISLSQVIISNSTISNNTTQSTNGSGGLYIYGSTSLLIENTTVSGNSSIANGGGIAHVEYDGPTYLVVNNSTISGNTTDGAGGGVYFDNAVAAVLTNVTVTDNIAAGDGGGIDIEGSTNDVTLVQSLVAGNTAVGAGREVNVGGGGSTLTADAYNLFGFGGDSGLAGVTAGASDLEPVDALAAILDTTLADNGGDTFTHNLVVASPAVDAIPTVDCALPTDQRGVARPDGFDCDIGAVESPFDDVIFKNGFD